MGKRKARFKQSQSTLPNHVVDSYPAVEDFSVCSDDDGVDHEYVTSKENPIKTRQGGLNTKRRPVLPNMFATGGARCPVGLF